MALDPISVGSADDDGTGDALRTAFTKSNANDSYLEGLIAARGKNWKPSVRAATTANISLATDLEAGDTLDGVTLAEGDRVLVKDQTAGAENGIYDVPASGAASRSDDSDTGDGLLLAAVLVSEGTVNADKLFVCTTDAPITVDTTVLVWDDRTQAGIAEAPNDGQEYVRKNEAWAVATGGGGGAYNGARSTLSVNLTTVDASSGYLVPFDTEVRDVGGWHDPSTNNTRHTVPAGVDRISIVAALAADDVAAGEVAVLSLWKNGAALNPSPGQQASPTAALTSAYCSIHSGDLDVSENDYFELRLFCSDSSITIREANTFFDIKAES